MKVYSYLIAVKNYGGHDKKRSCSCWNKQCKIQKTIQGDLFNYTLFFIYKQPVYKQLGLDLQKVKQLLGFKHVTISKFANKIFAYVNIATTLHNHILYTANVNQYIVQNGCHSFFLIS